ncbi:MAG TPA: DUF5715 family protein [Methylomirabilota bacterium]|nr:DUF5715 family protein [Methylomirabilota bacterium]
MAAGLLLAAPGGAGVLSPTWCHRVRAGETLATLAARHGTSVATLAGLNARSPDARLLAGLTLAMPALAALRGGQLRLPDANLAATAGNLERENRAADGLRLSRMQDDRTVARFVRAGRLVSVPRHTATLWVEGVPDALRVARPWTRRFVEQLAAAARDLFGTRLKITSLTRTVALQARLDRSNPNAAPAAGRRRSTHLTGAAVDISKRPHTAPEIRWLRAVLARLEGQGLLLAIEEFAQPHFHVMVLPRYLAYARSLTSASLIGGC